MAPVTRSRSTAPTDRKKGTAKAVQRGKSTARSNDEEKKLLAIEHHPLAEEEKKLVEPRGRGRRPKAVIAARIDNSENEEEDDDVQNRHTDTEENEERALVIDEKPAAATKRNRKQAKSTAPSPAPAEETLVVLPKKGRKQAKSVHLPTTPTVSLPIVEEPLALVVVEKPKVTKRARKPKLTAALQEEPSATAGEGAVPPKKGRVQTEAIPLPQPPIEQSADALAVVPIDMPKTATKRARKPKSTAPLHEEPSPLVEEVLEVIPPQKRGRRMNFKADVEQDPVSKPQPKRTKQDHSKSKDLELPTVPSVKDQATLSTKADSVDDVEKMQVDNVLKIISKVKAAQRKVAEPKSKKTKVAKETVAIETKTEEIVVPEPKTVPKKPAIVGTEKKQTTKETEKPAEKTNNVEEVEEVNQVNPSKENGSSACVDKPTTQNVEPDPKVFIADIKKMVYKKNGEGAATSSGTVVQSGTLDFRVTSNNSLYIEMKKEVAMVVDKLKIETEQSFDEQNGSEPKENENVVTPQKATSSTAAPATTTNGTDSEAASVTFSIAQEHLTSTPIQGMMTVINPLNSTLDNFRKRKAETVEVEAKRRVVLRVGGKVFVFGGDIGGEMGLGEFGIEKHRPVPLPFDHLVAEVYSGAQHSVLLTSDGKIYSFGNNDECALGRVTATAENQEEVESTPALVDLPVKVVLATAGDSHTAVLDESGCVYYWGSFRDSNGSIGITAEETKPSLIPRLFAKDFTHKVKKIVSGANFLLILTEEGQIYSLGNGECGALGRLTPAECKFDKSQRSKYLNPAPIFFPGKLLCDKVWAGEFAAFARSVDGRLFSWGLDNYSQLGFAPASQREEDLCIYQPKEITFFRSIETKIEKICGGQHHTLALDSEGQVYSFGRSNYGRLGHGELTEDMIEPKLISFFKDKKVVDISCSLTASFAVTDKGELYSWGMGASVLGLGQEEKDAHVPTRVKSKYLENKIVDRVAAGSQHCLIVASEHSDSS